MPQLHSEIGSYWCESPFFVLNKFLLILFEELPILFLNYSEQITLQHTVTFSVNIFSYNSLKHDK